MTEDDRMREERDRQINEAVSIAMETVIYPEKSWVAHLHKELLAHGGRIVWDRPITLGLREEIFAYLKNKGWSIEKDDREYAVVEDVLEFILDIWPRRDRP